MLKRGAVGSSGTASTGGHEVPLLPLWGQICCRLMAQPDCATEPRISGFINLQVYTIVGSSECMALRLCVCAAYGEWPARLDPAVVCREAESSAMLEKPRGCWQEDARTGHRTLRGTELPSLCILGTWCAFIVL